MFGNKHNSEVDRPNLVPSKARGAWRTIDCVCRAMQGLSVSYLMGSSIVCRLDLKNLPTAVGSIQ